MHIKFVFFIKLELQHGTFSLFRTLYGIVAIIKIKSLHKTRVPEFKETLDEFLSYCATAFLSKILAKILKNFFNSISTPPPAIPNRKKPLHLNIINKFHNL